MAIIKPKGILYKHQLVFLGEELHLAEHFASHEAGQNTVRKQRNFMSPSIQRDCFFWWTPGEFTVSDTHLKINECCFVLLIIIIH